MQIIQDPTLLFSTLILPSLFALTHIVEGWSKILKKESGWINFSLGAVVLSLAVFTYFSFLR